MYGKRKNDENHQRKLIKTKKPSAVRNDEQRRVYENIMLLALNGY